MVDTKATLMTLQAWEWMCQQETFLIKDVIAVTGMSEAHIYKVVRDWLAAGHLIKHPDGVVSRPAYFKVVSAQYVPPIGKSSGQKRPKCRNKRKTNQQKMWNTMKISRFFTLSDLAITSGVDDSGASTYTTFLIRAGYVRLVDKIERFKVKGDQNRYQLIRDTGRFAPMVRAKQGGCWDQNEQHFYQFDVKEAPHGNVA